MPKPRPVTRLPTIASPTIAEVLAEFLADQKARVAARTFAQYGAAVGLLQDCLNGYAHQSLDAAERVFFDRHYNAEGDAHRGFCEVFGPDHILPNVGEFLGYFMVRKVMAGKDVMRAAGIVTKKLAVWLAERDYVSNAAAQDGHARGAAAARDLPKASSLASALALFAEDQPRGLPDDDDEIEDHFTITRVEARAVWLDGMDGEVVGPIALPERLARECRVGWTIAGTVAKVRGRWRLVEAWNVYPG